MPAAPDRLILAAPPRLVAETRVDFRCAAMEYVGRVGDSGGGALIIDLGRTHDVDASGLGILVLVQKKAREKGVTTRLAGVSDRLHGLLKLTKLDALFEFVT
jgi:anti-anti-sigma factor